MSRQNQQTNSSKYQFSSQIPSTPKQSDLLWHSKDQLIQSNEGIKRGKGTLKSKIQKFQRGQGKIANNQVSGLQEENFNSFNEHDAHFIDSANAVDEHDYAMMSANSNQSNYPSQFGFLRGKINNTVAPYVEVIDSEDYGVEEHKAHRGEATSLCEYFETDKDNEEMFIQPQVRDIEPRNNSNQILVNRINEPVSLATQSMGMELEETGNMMTNIPNFNGTTYAPQKMVPSFNNGLQMVPNSNVDQSQLLQSVADSMLHLVGLKFELLMCNRNIDEALHEQLQNNPEGQQELYRVLEAVQKADSEVEQCIWYTLYSEQAIQSGFPLPNQ